MRPYVRAANVGWGGLLLDDVKSMNFTDTEMEVYRLEAGDLLLNEASGSQKEVGKPAIWGGEIDGCAFQNTLLRVRPRGADPRYLLHYFRSQAEHGRFAAESRGVGIHHLGREALATWMVPLPPIEEQRRIAAVLDHADDLRAKRRTSLALLDSLTESIFLEMFGDPIANPLGWPEREPLGQFADITSGITKGRRVADHGHRSVPYLAVANVQDGHLRLNAIKSIDATEDEIRRLRLEPGDLVLTEGGDPDKLGRGTVWTGELAECIHQNHVFRVRLTDPDFEPLFVSKLLASERGRRYFLRSAKQTTGIASINKSQLGAFPMLRPPKGLQAAFAARLEEHRALYRTAAEARAELDALFASLQQRAFSGQL
jgi:type I restriction enzyme S subunit